MLARTRRPLVVTCEHGGNRVPSSLASNFVGADDDLSSHRGFDAGALSLAREMSRELHGSLAYSTLSRLVVDMNRRATNRAVFSEFTRSLAPPLLDALLSRHHHPHRAHVYALVKQASRGGRSVVHVAAHSFTPVLGGVVRDVDIGLLYDPARNGEREFVKQWIDPLQRTFPHLRIRKNRPYLGTSDGLTTWLRSSFPERAYVGIELEVSHALLAPDGSFRSDVREGVIETLRKALARSD